MVSGEKVVLGYHLLSALHVSPQLGPSSCTSQRPGSPLELARMEELGAGGCLALLHLHVRQAASIRPFVAFGKNLLELQNLFFFSFKFQLWFWLLFRTMQDKKKKSYPRAKIDEGSRETGCLSSLNGSFSF